jgi:hypothetical protein
MPEAITFYTHLRFVLVYGSPHARFSTLQAGDALVNPMLTRMCSRPGGGASFSALTRLPPSMTRRAPRG